MRNPRPDGPRAPGVRRHAEPPSPTSPPTSAQLARLPRRLLRKIVIEPSPGGWRCRIVGFDPRFHSDKASGEYLTRASALEAAHAASRHCGLPVVTIETFDPDRGPDQAA